MSEQKYRLGEPPQIRLVVLDPRCAPTKAYPTDAGWDVYARGNAIVWGLDRVKVPLGIKLDIPPGFFGLIQEKSGMALNQGIQTIGNVIDSGYHGEIHAILQNTSPNNIEIKDGQKVAQLIIMPFIEDEFVRCEGTDEFTPTLRGEKGFGSSGL